jgi:REP element-mobilizing transposase RayT
MGSLIRAYSGFCGVEVFTLCVMSNHIHILAEVPTCQPEQINDAELLRRLSLIYPSRVVVQTELALARAAALGGEEGVALRERIRAPYLRRMGVLAEFVKGIKQCFTQWLNNRNEREGTAWEGRFRSVLVGGDSPEGTASVLRLIAAYIDLNPVRAGIVENPEAYPWSGWGAAANGDEGALQGYGRLLGKGAEGTGAATAAQLARYRTTWLEGGVQVRQEGDKKAAKPGRGGHQVVPVLRRRIPGLSRVAAVGEAGFIDSLDRRGLFAGRLPGLAACVIAPQPTGAGLSSAGLHGET